MISEMLSLTGRWWMHASLATDHDARRAPLRGVPL